MDKREVKAMLNEHQSEKANFRAIIEQDGAGRVEERLNIIDTFLEIEKHITVDELTEHLNKKGYDYDAQFVGQCMKQWVDYGFAQKKEFEGKPLLYEHRHLGRHHDHLICVKCGKITEFENAEIENLQSAIAAAHGFKALQHKMEIYGLCSECSSRRQALMPLTMAKPGERLIIMEMRAGRHARERLVSLGLNPGDAVEVINNINDGRLVIAHNNTRVAIGRGIGEKILVTVDNKD